MKGCSILAAILLLIATDIVKPQSNTNPDISLIGTFNTFTDFGKDSPGYHKLNFDNPALELFVDGYLNPFARAASNIAYEDNRFSVEELYAEVLRGLPLDIQIRAGKFLLGFGKLNTVHPHAWPFPDRPLFHQVYFGSNGFNDIGFNFSLLLPTGDIYSSLDLGIYKGDAIGKNEAPAPDDPASLEAARGTSPIFAGRLGAFFNLSDFTDFEAGISSSYGIHSKTNFTLTDNPAQFENRSLYYTYAGIDFKLKYKPDSYTALTVQGEAMLNHRDVFRLKQLTQNQVMDQMEVINTTGSFIYLDYRFDKMFSAGARYDFTYGIVGDIPSFYTLSNDDQNKTQGISAWFGYYPVEETLALRLGAQHLIYSFKDNRTKADDTELILQLIFSLGPHKAHPF